MIIYYDFSYLYQKPNNYTGIQRVVRCLYGALKEVAPSQGIDAIVPVALIGGRFKGISDQLIFPKPTPLRQAVPIRGTSAFVDVRRRESSSPKALAKRLLDRVRCLDVPPLVQRSARYVRNCISAVGAALTKPDSDLVSINPMPGDWFLTGDTAWDRSEQFWLLVDEWRGRGVKAATIFYDALPYNEPDFFLSRNVQLWRSYFLRAIHSTDLWAAISETARQDLLRMIAAEAPGMKPVAISFPMGVSHEALGFDPAWLIEAPADQGQLILCVGSLDARKGHSILLDALGKSSTARVLIFGRDTGAGAQAIATRILRHPLYGSRLFWIRDGSDRELAYWYQQCRAIVCPSRAEGFGLPLIEAAWYGKQVIANRIPIFEEVSNSYGLGVCFYETDSCDSLATALDRCALGEELQKDGNTGVGVTIPIPDWSISSRHLLKEFNPDR
jgi:glycosyltransferase involved in cell wall biosynthesis